MEFLGGVILYSSIYWSPRSAAVREVALSLSHSLVGTALGTLWAYTTTSIGDFFRLGSSWISPSSIADRATELYAGYLVVDVANAHRSTEAWSLVMYAHHFVALGACALGLATESCSMGMPVYLSSEISSIFLNLRQLRPCPCLDLAFATTFLLVRLPVSIAQVSFACGYVLETRSVFAVCVLWLSCFYCCLNLYWSMIILAELWRTIRSPRTKLLKSS
jgi:hypothetical protein